MLKITSLNQGLFWYYNGMQKLIIIRGYPGSGKTTLGKALAKKLGYVFIDHNQILTFIAKYTGDDNGIYNEISGLELAMTTKLLSAGKSVIVARGFSKPSSIDQYIDAGKLNNAVCTVLRLDAPVSVLIERVQSLTRKDDFNPTKSEASLSKWITQNPIQNYPGEKMLDATLPIKDLVNSTLRIR